MKALILVTAIVLSTLASSAPSNAGFIPQPPKIYAAGAGKTTKSKNVAINSTHPATGTLTKCKKSGKKCVKSNGKFVTP
jgi:hypothetical protein